MRDVSNWLADRVGLPPQENEIFQSAFEALVAWRFGEAGKSQRHQKDLPAYRDLHTLLQERIIPNLAGIQDSGIRFWGNFSLEEQKRIEEIIRSIQQPKEGNGGSPGGIMPWLREWYSKSNLPFAGYYATHVALWLETGLVLLAGALVGGLLGWGLLTMDILPADAYVWAARATFWAADALFVAGHYIPDSRGQRAPPENVGAAIRIAATNFLLSLLTILPALFIVGIVLSLIQFFGQHWFINRNGQGLFAEGVVFSDYLQNLPGLIADLLLKTRQVIKSAPALIPEIIRPEIDFPGESIPPITDQTFEPEYFAEEMPRQLIRILADLMDYIQVTFVNDDTLPQGYTIDNHASQTISGVQFKQRTVTTTITVSNKITFIQLLKLVEEMYRQGQTDHHTNSAGYQKILLEKLKSLENMAKYFIYAADFLETVKTQWPAKLKLDPRQTPELVEFLDLLIKGYRKLTAGYLIQTADSPKQKRAMVKSWLGMDEQWPEKINKIKLENRSQVLERFLAIRLYRWARNLAYEITGPVRELHGALMERGGRLLDGIMGKEEPDQELLAIIDKRIADESVDFPPKAATIIQAVQSEVSKYYDETIPDNLLLENSPSAIIATKQMSCAMMNYLCGRILQQKGFNVFWLNIVENYESIKYGHVAILAKLPEGAYQIVDAAQQGGAGKIDSNDLPPDEVEKKLSQSISFVKVLDTNSHSLHHIR